MWPPQIQHNTVTTGRIRYWLARLWLGLLGWDVVGELPAHRKFVLIGAPHTSNWDFFIGIPALYIFRIKAFWMGKHTLFWGPLGPLSRALGGIAIERSSAHGVVHQTAEQLKAADQLVIGIPPKGTRGRSDYWKSGFYHIAVEARVPIVCGYMDYSTKTARMGLCLEPTGDIAADMDKIREFFAPARGKYPELEDTVRLKEEDQDV